MQPVTEALGDKVVGTHSIRKGTATYLQSLAFNIPEIAMRGRWSVSGAPGCYKMMMGRYTHEFSPVLDAKLAEKLLGPQGVARPVFKDPRLRTDTFLKGVIPRLYDIMHGKYVMLGTAC